MDSAAEETRVIELVSYIANNCANVYGFQAIGCAASQLIEVMAMIAPKGTCPIWLTHLLLRQPAQKHY